MDQMNAAVVTSFEQPPRYQRFDVPRPKDDSEVLADVLAVGLHPRTRTGASGAHYTSTGTLPMIPGIDGVGQLPDGKQVYFVAEDDVIGTMAERAIVDRRRAVELPPAVDIAKIAATMNPAMSAWVALRRRVPIEAGQSVLVLGATGNAGSMAVQVAKRLGAGRVVGAGRDLARLEALTAVGADDLVQLTGDAEATARALGHAAGEVDIVIDYLWGKPAETGDAGAAHRTIGPQPGAGLDPDRGDGRSDDRAAIGAASISQPPAAGQRARGSFRPGLPR